MALMKRLSLGDRVPRDLRDDLAEEWQAELEFVLTGAEGMPLTRLVRGIRYTAGLLHGSDRMNLVWAAPYILFLMLLAMFRQMLRRDELRWREIQELRALHASLYPDCTECLGPRATHEPAPARKATGSAEGPKRHQSVRGPGATLGRSYRARDRAAASPCHWYRCGC
jgi:hypothetical protein